MNYNNSLAYDNPLTYDGWIYSAPAVRESLDVDVPVAGLNTCVTGIVPIDRAVWDSSAQGSLVFTIRAWESIDGIGGWRDIGQLVSTNRVSRLQEPDAIDFRFVNGTEPSERHDVRRDSSNPKLIDGNLYYQQILFPFLRIRIQCHDELGNLKSTVFGLEAQTCNERDPLV